MTFKRRHQIKEAVQLTVDGDTVIAEAGNSVAAAILAHSRQRFRSTVLSNSARAPYCLIGHCFECLVEIDGLANCQACLTPVREGMQVRRQHGPITIDY